MLRQLSRIITTSIEVRLSSMEVGLDGETKWSYKLLQSVTTKGLRLDNTSRHFPTSLAVPGFGSYK